MTMGHLPVELRIPIGQWDVSRVTDFEKLFQGEYAFNEDLRGWNVENAINMDDMFEGCTFFDQSLETWKPRNLTTCYAMFRNCTNFTGDGLNEWGPYLSNVEYMTQMFKGCEHLDTPLDQWNTQQVTDMSEMFKGCEHFRSDIRMWNVHNVTHFDGMFEMTFPPQNRPRFGLPRDAHVELNGDNGRVDVAREVHEAVNKVNFERLIPYLRDYVGKERPVIIDYKTLVYTTMAGFVERISESKQMKRQQMIDLGRIMTERLNGLNFTHFSPLLLDALFYAIEFVKLQPIEFIAIYVGNFITDCVHAYTNGNTMSCSQGVIERTFMTLGATCERISVLMPETDYLEDENKTYKDLANLITATPMYRIPDLILDWYKAHKDGAGLPSEVTNSMPANVREEAAKLKPDQVRRLLRRRNLEQSLLEAFPKEGDLIRKIMSTHSNIIGYNNDNFAY